MARDMKNTEEHLRNAVCGLRRLLDLFLGDRANIEALDRLADRIVRIFGKGGKVLICGNGGAHCDALHFAEEFTGRFRKDRPPLPAIALGEASHVTCVGNDFGFDEIFRRQVEAFGKKGDLLIGLSTSGNSQNVILALAQAKKQGLVTAALLGKDGGRLRGFCDFEWVVPAGTSDRIQELHMCMLHALIEAVERRLYPAQYKGE